MSRIYRVQNGTTSALVRANTKSQAVRFVAASQIQAEVATQDDCVKLAAAGVEVQDAIKED